MEKFPCFNWFPRDWIAGTATLTLEQQGAFARLLSYAWEQTPPCTLPDSDRALASLLGVSVGRWRKIGTEVRSKFEACGNGRIRNPKLFAVYTEMVAHRAKRSRAGQLGNEARWTSQTDRNAIANGIAEPIAKASPPIPTPIPSTDKQKPPKSPKGEYSPEFLSFWAEYPTRIGSNSKASAWRAWKARLADEYTAEVMTAGAKRYAAYCFDTNALRTQFVKMASSFLGSDLHFLEPWTSPPKRGIVPPAGSVNERPQSAGTRSEGWSTAGGQRLESEEQRDDKRVTQWRTENPDKAQALWQECVNEIAEMFTGNRGQFTEVAARAMVSSKFRARVIAEHLTPRLSA